MQASCYTAGALAKEKKIPELYQVTKHLVFSSPATLAYNSPGAEGFGVKRAGLSIPESVMLIVSPGCCGRNTSQISDMPQYQNRFFYLQMDETDLVTGRHLKRIPQAVCEIAASLEKKPKLVMICATCVDALLGTDWDRVCRKAEEASGVRVRPSFMYALTREGIRPPMVHVRQSLYSLLEERKRDRTAVNLLGFFSPVASDWEMYGYLRKAGVKKIRQISACSSYEQFEEMAEANFNLVLNPECRPAADDLAGRLKIPYIALRRFYDPDRIHRQYGAFAKAAGIEIQDREDCQITCEMLEAFCRKMRHIRVSIGECANADPFELALTLASRGIMVEEIFASVNEESIWYLKELAGISPDTKIYSNQDPSMLYYEEQEADLRLTIGKDAACYHPDAAHVLWNSDLQPFGYAGVRALVREMEAATDGHGAGKTENRTEPEEKKAAAPKTQGGRRIPGFRKHLTPFAPDQSGAVSVCYALGGIVVIVDAGGCAGNICGFDEPRWQPDYPAYRAGLHRSEEARCQGICAEENGGSKAGGKSHPRVAAVFSAGLRDMDAILGRDDLLVKKLTDAARKIDAKFIALVGTPVPAVIGTDLESVAAMTRRAVSLPCIAVSTDGMHLYDRGIEMALLEIMKTFAGEKEDFAKEVPKRICGVLGLNPLDLFDPAWTGAVRDALLGKGYDEVLLHGMEGGLDTIARCSLARKNYVVSASGIAAAEYLKRRFQIPYEVGFPADPMLLLEENASGVISSLRADARILVVHEQVLAGAIRDALKDPAASHLPACDRPGTDAKPARSITVATWFDRKDALSMEGDVSLREEEDFTSLVREGNFDLIIADPALRPMAGEYRGGWIDAYHFAVSGQAVINRSRKNSPERRKE